MDPESKRWILYSPTSCVRGFRGTTAELGSEGEAKPDPQVAGPGTDPQPNGDMGGRPGILTPTVGTFEVFEGSL